MKLNIKPRYMKFSTTKQYHVKPNAKPLYLKLNMGRLINFVSALFFSLPFP